MAESLPGSEVARSRSGRSGPRSARRSWLGALTRVAARPELWPIALRTAGRLARPRWWRRPPFLPLPDRAYLAFRLETQYGTGGAPEPRDLVTYLSWCRAEDARRSSPSAR